MVTKNPSSSWLTIFQQFRSEVQQMQRESDMQNYNKYEKICKDFIEVMEDYILND